MPLNEHPPICCYRQSPDPRQVMNMKVLETGRHIESIVSMQPADTNLSMSFPDAFQYANITAALIKANSPSYLNVLISLWQHSTGVVLLVRLLILALYCSQIWWEQLFQDHLNSKRWNEKKVERYLCIINYICYD